MAARPSFRRTALLGVLLLEQRLQLLLAGLELLHPPLELLARLVGLLLGLLQPGVLSLQILRQFFVLALRENLR